MKSSYIAIILHKIKLATSTISSHDLCLWYLTIFSFHIQFRQLNWGREVCLKGHHTSSDGRKGQDRLKLQWSYTFRLNFCVLWIMFVSKHKELSWLERNAIWSALQPFLKSPHTCLFWFDLGVDCQALKICRRLHISKPGCCFFFFFSFLLKVFNPVHLFIYSCLFSESLLSARHCATCYRCNH